MTNILEQFRLDGKVALVTGCTRGLGQAMAVALAQAGANVFGVSASESAEETAKLIRLEGRRFEYLSADLRTTEPIEEIITKALNTFGRIDILVNNAGIIRRNNAIDFNETDWDDVIGINLKLVFFLSQALARYWVRNNAQGKIINIASVLSFQGGIRVPSYTASKSGIRGLTMALANEWAPYGIHVNAIAPGYMVTDNTEALWNDPNRSKEILGRIPAGRWGDASDLAGAVVFLASTASDYVHGQVLAVDGGWLAR